MRVLLELKEWEACRLKSLVADGLAILEAQGRTQKGIDGYTKDDLIKFRQFLDGVSPNIPQFANKTKIVCQ